MSNQGKAFKGVLIGVTVAAVAAHSAIMAVILWVLFAGLSWVKGH